MTWPIYYPDRPDIPYDQSAESYKIKRRGRKYAEAGNRKGSSVKKIPHYGKVNESEKPHG